MALALDRELVDFFNFLGHQIGLVNVWIALSADHGVSALPDAAKKLRIPAANLDGGKSEAETAVAATAAPPGHSATYINLIIRLHGLIKALSSRLISRSKRLKLRWARR